MSIEMTWLPTDPTSRARIKALRGRGPDAPAWQEAVAIATTRLDFPLVNGLDAAIQAVFATLPADLGTRPIRLAILASATATHLHAAIRVGGVRRGLWIETYGCEYGQYRQELADPASPLHRFQPDAVLLALDAHHLLAGLHAGLEAADAAAVLDDALSGIEECWRMARHTLGASVIQQTLLPLHPALLGGNEHRLPGSRHAAVARLNALFRERTGAQGVDLLAVDDHVAQDGLAAWHDVALWHRSKQEIAPAAAPLYGDLVARLLAARQGRSAKCLVLDLDNTLWGGVIGDDGIDGIVLGQGSPLGEAFVALQDYARDQARRGTILAVCSKNDEANAVEPFMSHPDMVLRRSDIASFMANWDDKAANIRAIAHTLGIGLDAMVFVDDNPAERALVRQELPMVMVPELPEDPALVVPCLAAAGYFEGVAVTAEDRSRAAQYQGNIQRETLRSASGGLGAYLQNLQMALIWRPFDRVGLQRTVQLINKTNQFNLTTRRYTEDEVLAVMADPTSLGLQFRLLDRFGDNGIIAIVIGRREAADFVIDTWLMSCRVLGRGVEQATLRVVAAEAARLGAGRLIGAYRPSKKNGMVREHYARLGFAPLDADADVNAEGGTRHVLGLDSFAPPETVIDIKETTLHDAR